MGTSPLVLGTSAVLCMSDRLSAFDRDIGDIYGNVPVTKGDSLLSDPGYRVDYVLTNPPFGKKSSITMTNEEGEEEEEELVYNHEVLSVPKRQKTIAVLHRLRRNITAIKEKDFNYFG